MGGPLPPSFAYDKNRDGKQHKTENSYIGNLTYDHMNEIQALSRRLDFIERSLGYSNITEITPVSALLSSDLASEDAIRNVYNNWSSFMEYIAQQLNTRHFKDLFWTADKFLFNHYFKNKSLTYRFIGTPEEYETIDPQTVSNAIAHDRYEESPHALRFPSDNEFIQYHVDKDNNLIYIFYRLEEIRQNADPPASIDDVPIVSGLDSYSIFVHNNPLTIDDRRHHILGTHRGILYNTIIDTTTYERMKNAILKAGNKTILAVCIILLHAMVHLKCTLEYGEPHTHIHRHSKLNFVTEIIRIIPPALFGHPYLPIITTVQSSH